jgi:hypothetical protein
VFTPAKEWISDIKFSPDGSICAIGSHDNAIYAFKTAVNKIFKYFFRLGKNTVQL